MSHRQIIIRWGETNSRKINTGYVVENQVLIHKQSCQGEATIIWVGVDTENDDGNAEYTQNKEDLSIY